MSDYFNSDVGSILKTSGDSSVKFIVPDLNAILQNHIVAQWFPAILSNPVIFNQSRTFDIDKLKIL